MNFFANLNCPQLTIQFPKSSLDWEKVRCGFSERSRHNVFTGYGSAMDVYFRKQRHQPKSRLVIFDHIIQIIMSRMGSIVRQPIIQY